MMLKRHMPAMSSVAKLAFWLPRRLRRTVGFRLIRVQAAPAASDSGCLFSLYRSRFSPTPRLEKQCFTLISLSVNPTASVRHAASIGYRRPANMVRASMYGRLGKSLFWSRKACGAASSSWGSPLAMVDTDVDCICTSPAAQSQPSISINSSIKKLKKLSKNSIKRISSIPAWARNTASAIKRRISSPTNSARSSDTSNSSTDCANGGDQGHAIVHVNVHAAPSSSVSPFAAAACLTWQEVNTPQACQQLQRANTPVAGLKSAFHTSSSSGRTENNVIKMLVDVAAQLFVLRTSEQYRMCKRIAHKADKFQHIVSANPELFSRKHLPGTTGLRTVTNGISTAVQECKPFEHLTPGEARHYGVLTPEENELLTPINLLYFEYDKLDTALQQYFDLCGEEIQSAIMQLIPPEQRRYRVSQFLSWLQPATDYTVTDRNSVRGKIYGTKNQLWVHVVLESGTAVDTGLKQLITGYAIQFARPLSTVHMHCWSLKNRRTFSQAEYLEAMRAMQLDVHLRYIPLPQDKFKQV